MKGLYFYKLVSPYEEDVTKDCKLTINEIDHNFKTLKDADIKEFSFDKDSKIVSLTRNNKEEMRIDLSPLVEGMTTNLKVDYDSIDGVITIEYNGEIYTISGLITNDNLSDKVLTEVTSDGTLNGLGSKYVPMGLASVEKTGSFKPAKKLINKTIGEFLPKNCHNIKGDRFVTLENISEFGYLYKFNALAEISKDLKNGWRIPTKEDWDNMLNAIEPCDEFRNHNSALANNMLGRLAGKYLKSKDYFLESGECNDINCDCDKKNDEYFDVTSDFPKTEPDKCMVSPKGIDSYGMRLLPSGFDDGCEISDYFGKRGYYWSSTAINETDIYVKRFDCNKAGVVQNVESPRNYFSLRLVKDYDGSNNLQTEEINGMLYNTILMPALNTEHGHSIWTAENIAFPNEKYNPIEPNKGQGLKTRKAYFINEWNGFDWERKEMHEGESIVLMSGLKGEKNIEYRIIDGTLVSVAKVIYDDVMSEIKPEIDRIDDIIGEGLVDENGKRVTLTDKIKDIDSTLGTGFTDENGEKITVTDKVIEVEQDLNQEIADRTEADNKLQEELDIEVTNRAEADKKIQDELDRVEKGTGLDLNGNYQAKTDAHYVSGANSIHSATLILDEALNNEEISRTTQDSIITTNVGLSENGKYIVKENSNYISEATTIAESIDFLDQELKGTDLRLEQLVDEVDRAEKSTGLDDNGNYHPTEGKFTSGATTIKGAIEDADTALEVEESERIKQDNKIEESIGLDNNGNYVKTDGNYTSDATTIVSAIDSLDKALKTEEIERINEDNTIENSIGLKDDGSYIPTEGKFTSNANSIRDAINKLDDALVNEETERINKDEELHGRLIQKEQPDDAYDCKNGVLTLSTEDPVNKITIKLTGDYGEFPYEEIKG